MSQAIANYLDNLPDEAKNEIESLGLKPGDFIVTRSNDWRVITGFEIRGNQELLYVLYRHFHDPEKTGSFSMHEFNSYYMKSRFSPEQIEEKAFQALRDPAAFDKLKQGAKDSSVTALVASSGKDRLEAYQSELTAAALEIELIKRHIEAKVSHLTHYAYEMRQYIQKMSRVISVFELYLGVNEEIVQLQEGLPESPATPISLRQLILYMDEEVGDPRDDGIDWTKVDDFDEWLTTDENYKKIIPETKGIVGLRPSRRKRWHWGKFAEVPFLAVQENDYRFYLLIRNGDNLYRIFTSVNTGPYMFPTSDQISFILENMDRDNFRSRQDLAEDEQLKLARNALIIKGLIERTQIFMPLAHLPNIENPKDKLLNFIHDGENLLPAARLPYFEWLEELNQDLKVGSRILLSKIHRDYHDERRFLADYSYRGKPPKPKPGVYKINKILPPKKYSNRGERLLILYNPGDIVHGGWDDWYGHERKNRVSYIVHRSDYFVFNYDRLDLADIDFYLESRVDRESYYEMMPMLWELRSQRLEEIEYEKHLVALICNETQAEADQVWQAIEWFKTKNKWKRPVNEDDAKALRMIKRKLAKKT